MALRIEGNGVEPVAARGIGGDVQNVVAAETVLADGLPGELGLDGLDQAGADYERQTAPSGVTCTTVAGWRSQ
jgi:hypothetical protein